MKAMRATILNVVDALEIQGFAWTVFQSFIPVISESFLVTVSVAEVFTGLVTSRHRYILAHHCWLFTYRV